MEPYLRLIGDIHGEQSVYLSHVADVPYTLQLGDLDHDYSHLSALNADVHRFLPGNCDNYDLLRNDPHSLGDYGVWDVPDFGPIFYVRGAWSIDWRAKTDKDIIRGGVVVRKKDLWDDEELPPKMCYKAYDAYVAASPKFVATHTCPDSIFSLVSSVGKPSKTRTGTTLEAMLQVHRPKMWVFGHHHVAFDREIDGTRFVCVNAFRFLDLPKDFVNNL